MPKKSNKKTEVIVLQPLSKSNPGSIIEVACGFARNFLIPTKKAAYLTSLSKQHIESLRSSYLAAEEKKKEALLSAMEQLHEKEFVLTGLHDSETSTLYEAIGVEKIVHVLREATGVQLSKEQIKLESHIKKLGNYTVEVKLDESATAHVILKVL